MGFRIQIQEGAAESEDIVKDFYAGSPDNRFCMGSVAGSTTIRGLYRALETTVDDTSPALPIIIKEYTIIPILQGP